MNWEGDRFSEGAGHHTHSVLRLVIPGVVEKSVRPTRNGLLGEDDQAQLDADEDDLGEAEDGHAQPEQIGRASCRERV